MNQRQTRNKRTQQELMQLYNYYRENKDKGKYRHYNTKMWLQELGLHHKTFAKWKKGVEPRKNGEPYRREEKVDDTRYEFDFKEIADKLDMDLNQVKECYESGIQKIREELNQSKHNTLRESLNECEINVFDSVF